MFAVALRAPSLFAQREELPPSIAALKSMRDQARPIANDERRARIEKGRQLMGKEKKGGVGVTAGGALAYFPDIRWSGGERLFACVIPVKGEPFFVCPAFEEGRAMELIARGPVGDRCPGGRAW